MANDSEVTFWEDKTTTKSQFRTIMGIEKPSICFLSFKERKKEDRQAKNKKRKKEKETKLSFLAPSCASLLHTVHHRPTDSALGKTLQGEALARHGVRAWAR